MSGRDRDLGEERPGSGPTGSGADPEDILRARLARGEITVDQYRELLETLRETVA